MQAPSLSTRLLPGLLVLALLIATAIPAQAHGGGCRKDSPPGQCCHEQKSTGRVHCH